jgi:hypothetical protein
MPLYFFHLAAPDGYCRDDVGVEYPNVEAAYLGAYQAALEISVDLLRRQTDPNRHSFAIMDQAGQTLFELPFSEVMQPSRHALPPAELHARINRQQQRAVRAASELKQSVERTRHLLAATRKLLGRG